MSGPEPRAGFHNICRTPAHWAVVALGLCVMVWQASAAAQAQTADQLDAVERDLQKSTAEQRRMAQESLTVASELEDARRQSVALAKDIQDQDHALLLLENRLQELETDAESRASALSRRDAQMRQTLAALERLALRPADALTLTPLAPDDAVRTAILLRAAVPAIQSSATSLQTELASLYRLQREITDQREQVAAGAALLLRKQKELEGVINAKAAQQLAVTARSQELDAEVRRLSREAADLRALFAKLAEEKAKRAAAEKAEQAAQAAQAAATPAAPQPGRPAVVARAPAPPPATALAESRPFSKARGTLPAPVVGTLLARYGETPPGGSGGGLLNKGLTYRARAGAPVVSPYDGVVAFAGPFRGYGELLIIEHSEGYHTLLAGIGRIDAMVGQRVLAGEPVGTMSNDKAASLYVELRRDGQPINPLPWLAERRGSDQLGQSQPGGREAAPARRASPG